MMEALIPPDIEVIAIAILQPLPYWVSTTYPADLSQEAAGVIRVSATGGAAPRDIVVISPTTLIECWHEDEGEAHNIAAKAWSTLGASAGEMIDGTPINNVSLTLPVKNPDTARKNLTRYQFIAEISTRLKG